MQHSEQVRLIRRILAHMAAGTTDRGEVARSPVARYLSPERLAQEQALIRTLPVMVCASSSVAQPGDWFTHDLSGVPIVVARGPDGALRAFINACRHRGARVVDGSCGAGRRNFVCPYHSWSYELDGALRGLPHPEEFPGMDRAQHGLVPLPVTEICGLVWVVPAPTEKMSNAADMRAWLVPMADDLVSFGYDRFVAHDTRRFESRHDWKLVADANLETYHFKFLHRDSIAPLFQDNRMVADAFGDHWRITLPKESIVQLQSLPEHQWDLTQHCNIIYYFFPNLMFLFIGDHATLFAVWPRGIGASTIDAITLIPEPAATEKARTYWDRNVNIFWGALMEDFELMDSMQSTFASGANTHLTFGRSEFCAAAFEASVERHLAGNRLGPSATSRPEP